MRCEEPKNKQQMYTQHLGRRVIWFSFWLTIVSPWNSGHFWQVRFYTKLTKNVFLTRLVTKKIIHLNTKYLPVIRIIVNCPCWIMSLSCSLFMARIKESEIMNSAKFHNSSILKKKSFIKYVLLVFKMLWIISTDLKFPALKMIPTNLITWITVLNYMYRKYLFVSIFVNFYEDSEARHHTGYSETHF